MTNYNRRADVVAMDVNTADPHMVSFGKKTGCFLSRTAAWLMALFFVSAVAATGLLVYFYAPHVKVYEAEAHNLPHTATTFDPSDRYEDFPDVDMSDSTTTTTTTTTVPTTTTKPVPKKPNVRLPLSLKPVHYLVKLQPLINGNFSILGYVEVEVEVIHPTSNITLHIADIITHNDSIKIMQSGMGEGEEMERVISRHEYDNEREFYIAHLAEPLMKGQRYVLSMSFMGFLNEKLDGFYRSTYRDNDGNLKYLAATQFQATDARRAFPCFDEPGLKATFEIHLARETNMTSISNMPINETVPIEGQNGWVWDQYERTVPMSTYLLAFVVSDFGYVNASTDDRVLFRIWARKEALEQTAYAAKVGPPILHYFEEYFNETYPLPKQDMIALPDFSAGAMENWGLITYRETALLYDRKVSGPRYKKYVAKVVSHELAHQWFGNLVTPSWWTDLWLNEGFASYVENIGVDIVEPTWKVMDQFVVDFLQRVFSEDSLTSSHKISIPVGHPSEIWQIFDRISYDKGASIIRMMNHFLTENAFRSGLSDYLEGMKYQSAEQDDLWRYLTAAGHRLGALPKDLTVKTIMDTWTLQMGYPVITVTRNPDGTKASISQERFLLVEPGNLTDTHHYKWWVPLTYTSQNEQNFNNTQPKVWMKNTQDHINIKDLPAKDKWVIFNLQETGYYRVNYDPDNWQLLISQLLQDHTVFPATNRAQIIDDAMDLARAGRLSYEVALSVYEYLGKEKEYVPWRAAVNNLNYIKSMMSRTGGYGALKRYISDLVVPLYESVGFQDTLDDPLLEHYVRELAIAWACSMDHKNCIDNALGLFREWMLNPDNNTIISPNLKSTVYCRALAVGGEEEWVFAWHQYLKSNVAGEKSKLLGALGCTKKLWLLSRYLEMGFDSKSGIRKQDTTRVFASVGHNSVGRPLAWNFLRDQWKKVYEFFDFKAKKQIISSATSNFNTKQQLQEVLDFKKAHGKELSAASRKVEQIIETTENNIAWMDKNYLTIVNWLESKGYSSKVRSFWTENNEIEKEEGKGEGSI